MDLSINTIFRNILAQEGQANIIKVLKRGKKQGDMLGKLQNMLGSMINQEKSKKAIEYIIKQDKLKDVDCNLKATSTPFKPQI